MYNDQLVYKVVIWVFFGISLWTEKVAFMPAHQLAELVGYNRFTNYSNNTWHMGNLTWEKTPERYQLLHNCRVYNWPCNSIHRVEKWGHYTKIGHWHTCKYWFDQTCEIITVLCFAGSLQQTTEDVVWQMGFYLYASWGTSQVRINFPSITCRNLLLLLYSLCDLF